jgi:hypothetical protein
MLHLYVQQKTVPEFEVVTSDDRNINDIIQELCDISHDALETVSVWRQEAEEEVIRNEHDIKSLQQRYLGIIEYLEGHFCEILEKLDD